MSSGRRGKDATAHSELNGGLGVLGERLVTTGGRWRSPAAEEEEDEVAGDAGRLASCGSSYMMNTTLRFFWAGR